MNQTELETKIGYTFADRALLTMALCHSSYANEHHILRKDNNERLEFLGDAVLELAVSDFLYRTNKDMPEGEMTKLRARIVCESTLFLCAKGIGLGQALLLGKGEDTTGGRERPSIVSDAMEALIGAIYLDGGFAVAKAFIERFILQSTEHLQLFFDSKTILQEIIQKKYHEQVIYEIIEKSEPDKSNRKTFSAQVRCNGRVLAKGTGHSKKAAEQDAAYHAIRTLREQE